MAIYDYVLANVEGKKTNVFLTYETFFSLIEETDQKTTFNRDGNMLLKKEDVCFSISIINSETFKKFQLVYAEKCVNGEYQMLYKKPDELFV